MPGDCHFYVLCACFLCIFYIKKKRPYNSDNWLLRKNSIVEICDLLWVSKSKNQVRKRNFRNVLNAVKSQIIQEHAVWISLKLELRKTFDAFVKVLRPLIFLSYHIFLFLYFGLMTCWKKIFCDEIILNQKYLAKCIQKYFLTRQIHMKKIVSQPNLTRPRTGR